MKIYICRHRYITHLIFVLGLLSFGICPNNFAADKTSARWFQIELLIFAHNNIEAESEEIWKTHPLLEYPNSLHFLQVARDPSASNTDATIPAAFEELDKSELYLHEAYSHLSRLGRYTPLFHKAWRQPVRGRKQAQSIFIFGGEQFSQNHQLEGSVRISVERYLHLQANLWLSHFSPNFGQKEYNIQLPIQPIEQAFNEDSHLTNSIPTNNFGTQLQHLLDNQYVADKTVTMRQNRRLRSKETHYIDHPLFGLLIRITPYDQEQALMEANQVQGGTITP